MDQRNCVECSQPFAPRNANQRICSKPCSYRRARKQRDPESKRAERARWRARNPDRRRRWVQTHKAGDQRRAARKKGGTLGKHFHFRDIAERDHWTCQLCDTKVNPDLAWPDPMSGSLDHVIPLARGGTHDTRNVQLAHCACNFAKGARTIINGEQLRLT